MRVIFFDFEVLYGYPDIYPIWRLVDSMEDFTNGQDPDTIDSQCAGLLLEDKGTTETHSCGLMKESQILIFYIPGVTQVVYDYYPLDYEDDCNDYVGDVPSFITCLDSRAAFLKTKIDCLNDFLKDIENKTNELNQTCSELGSIPIVCKETNT